MPRARTALVALAAGGCLSLAVTGCSTSSVDDPPVRKPPVDTHEVVSVSGGWEPFGMYAPPCVTTVTVTPDDQVVVTKESGDKCTDTSEMTGQAPRGTFEKIAAMVSADPYASLDEQLFPSTMIMDGTLDFVTVQTADQKQTKYGQMVSEYGPESFQEVHHAIEETARAAGLWSFYVQSPS